MSTTAPQLTVDQTNESDTHQGVDTIQYCTFWLSGQRFGIEVLEVQEVLRTTSMTAVPLAPDAVSGLINLRGQIITAIDLRRRLHLPEREPGARHVNIVVRTDEGPVSFLVDEIGAVHEVARGDHEPPPETVDATARQLMSGVYKVDGPLLHVLDVNRVIAELATSTANNRKGDA